MVHFKRVVLSLVFTLGSLISADVTIPSLKQIILAIPDDVVRGSIERAYMAGDFDEVERGLINFLEDYDYEDSGVENVDEVKEQAMGIVYERVKETRAAAFNDFASQAIEDPDSSEGEDMDEPIEFEEAKSYLKSMTLPDLVAKTEEGEAKKGFEEGADEDEDEEEGLESMGLKEIIESIPKGVYDELKEKILQDIADGDLNKAEIDIDELVDSLTVPKNERESVKAFLHKKIMEFGNDKEGFEEGADEDEAPYVEVLESMGLKEIIETLPDGEYKEMLLQDIADGDLNKAEIDIDKIADSLTVSEDDREYIKALLHKKIMAYVPTEAASELMEGESSIVHALRDIAETQQKITDLFNELEGGI